VTLIVNICYSGCLQISTTRSVIKDDFEFRSTRNGTKVIKRHGGFRSLQIPLQQQ
jgi:hypothetical protein